jgi:hypothetical protein
MMLTGIMKDGVRFAKKASNENYYTIDRDNKFAQNLMSGFFA